MFVWYEQHTAFALIERGCCPFTVVNKAHGGINLGRAGGPTRVGVNIWCLLPVQVKNHPPSRLGLKFIVGYFLFEWMHFMNMMNEESGKIVLALDMSCRTTHNTSKSDIQYDPR